MANTYKRSVLKNLDTYIESLFTLPLGAWSWFSDPRAVYYNGNTYLGIVNNSGDILVYKINGINIESYTLHSALEYDDHNNPSILVRPDGKIQCFYSSHNGTDMYYRISTNPEDITSWREEQVTGQNVAGENGYTYSNPFYLSSESKYYLFWRGANWQPSYSTSIDGETWSSASEFINSSGERPYVKYVSNNSDTIHFAFTDGHPNHITNNINHMYYRNGNFYQTNGTLINSISNIPFTPSQATQVYTSGDNSWIWDIALDINGYPVIVYSTFPNTTNHKYWYSRWDGLQWNTNLVDFSGKYLYSDEPYYSGGISIDHNNVNIVYASVNSGTEIKKFVTIDGGLNFTVTIVASGSKCIRPISIWNNTTNNEYKAFFLRGRYTTYINYLLKINYIY